MGGEIDIPTLTGHVKLKIPAETQTNKLFRLRGQGIKALRGGGTGDLLCRVIIETPVNLNVKQKELLEAFKQALGSESEQKHSPQVTSWLNNVKKFFDDLKR